MNKTILIGRLTADIELRFTQSQKAVAKFNLAVDRKFKKDGEKSTDFIICTIWDKQAELLSKYCKKGSKIAVSGRIETGSYDNKEGKKVYTTEVVVEEVSFLDSKKDTQESNQEKSQENNQEFDGLSDGEFVLPF